MDKSLSANFLAIENSLDRLSAGLSKYPHEILAKKPVTGAWSVLEVIQHLMIAEKGSLVYVKKKSGYPAALQNAGVFGPLGKLKLYLFMSLPIKVKAPAAVGEDHFDKNAHFEKLMAEWRQQRIELKAFLDQAPDDLVDKLTYKHPFAGRLTFDGMLLFFKFHLARHGKQIERALAQINAG